MFGGFLLSKQNRLIESKVESSTLTSLNYEDFSLTIL